MNVTTVYSDLILKNGLVVHGDNGRICVHPNNENDFIEDNGSE